MIKSQQDAPTATESMSQIIGVALTPRSLTTVMKIIQGDSPRPPRSQEERNIGNKGNNPETSENSTLRELSAAMDELRELIIRRPILAGLIQLKNCQGAETSPSFD
ncbi:hypothetical protein JTB14_005557 [Gonioctena quinquepunctata]|nr:hypothetical protein JTB14_005557 [Gonioctena quinquepunctata]